MTGKEPGNEPFLSGNYAPWPMEGEVQHLAMTGKLPRELNGTLYRNGPNPQFPPRGRYHWFDGDGMIHAITLTGGKARYRNRWVRTARFNLERLHGEALFGGLNNLSGGDLRANGIFPNAANTNILCHAGKTLALWEAGPPHEIDSRTLDTIGVYDFEGVLSGAMTAHPKLDPKSQALHFFGYSPFPPHLQYYVASKTGTIMHHESIETPVPTMMHDFFVTEEHVVFMAFPATIRPENLSTNEPIRWEPKLGTRVGVMSKDRASRDLTWLETDPCFAFHGMNSFTEGSSIIADVCEFPRLPLFGTNDRATDLNAPSLRRWILDLSCGSVRKEQKTDTTIEFPRLDERYSGRRYRYGFAAGIEATSIDANTSFNTVIRYDHQRENLTVYECGSDVHTSEPVFVPRTVECEEGKGFVLVLVYRKIENRSDLLVLDAEHIADGPIATVELPHRIPYGFHGNWQNGVFLD